MQEIKRGLFTCKGSVRLKDLLHLCYTRIPHSTVTLRHFVIFRCHVVTFDLGKMWEKSQTVSGPTRVIRS